MGAAVQWTAAGGAASAAEPSSVGRQANAANPFISTKSYGHLEIGCLFLFQRNVHGLEPEMATHLLRGFTWNK